MREIGPSADARREESTRSGTVLSVALIVLALVPTLGNALAVLTDLPRRGWQIASFAGSLGVLLTGLFRSGTFRGRIPPQFRWSIIIAFVVALGLTLTMAAPALTKGAKPGGYAVAAFAIATGWLAAALFNVMWQFGFHRTRLSHKPVASPSPRIVRSLILLISAGLAFIAYFKGPDPAQAYMSFGGSPIVTGTTAAIIASFGFVLAKGWFRFFSVLGATYLAFVATVRTSALVLLTVLASLVLADSLTGEKSPLVPGVAKRLLNYLGVLTLCLALVIVPARFWTFYPFFSSHPGQVVCLKNGERPCIDQQEYFFLQFRRWERLYKAILTRLGVKGLEIPEPAMPITLMPRAEGRLDLTIGSIRVVGRRPMGWWPDPFEQVMPMECGVPGVSKYFCTYPHNLVLEIGFHFGWLHLLILFVGLLAWSIRVVRSLRSDSPPVVRISGVSFLAWLAFAMVSGNLIDHMSAFLLGGIWLLLYWATEVQPAWSDVSIASDPNVPNRLVSGG